jgi:hypothetical protein
MRLFPRHGVATPMIPARSSGLIVAAFELF